MRMKRIGNKKRLTCRGCLREGGGGGRGGGGTRHDLGLLSETERAVGALEDQREKAIGLKPDTLSKMSMNKVDEKVGRECC